MLLEILQRINLLDVLFFLIFCRSVSIAIRKGFAVESFKLFGTYLGIYIALHYYTVLGDKLSGGVGFRSAPIEFVDFVAFLLLFIFSYNFAVLLRILIVRSRSQEALTAWSRWSAAVLGVVRGMLLAGIIAYGLAISTLTYFSDQIARSMMGEALFDIPLDVYAWTWENVTKNVSGNEQVNRTIQEVKKNLRGGSDEDEEYFEEAVPQEPPVAEVVEVE